MAEENPEKSIVERSTRKLEVDSIGSSLGSDLLLDDLLLMMHAAGDVSQPCKATATLVLNIVYSQICVLLSKASEMAELRNSNEIGIEDIVVLMRTSLSKCRQLHEYFYLKENKKLVMQGMEFENVGEWCGGAKLNKLSTILKNSIVLIDPSYTLLNDAKSNEDRMQRLQRAEEQTRCMNKEQYLFYSQARKVTFLKRMNKFLQWFVNFVDYFDTKPNMDAWEVIAYLAHETVVNIVHLALLIKHEKMSVEDIAATGSYDKVNIKEKVSTPLTTHDVSEAYRRYTATAPLHRCKINNVDSWVKDLIFLL
ncbi:transcription initiation protein SPT3 homolog [Ciona intestinalis]